LSFFIDSVFVCHAVFLINSFLIFLLKVASNIHDGEIIREIQHEDVTDHGRYATRVRSASTRSLDNRPLLSSDQQKVLGVGASALYEDTVFDDDGQPSERVVSTPDGKEVTCKFLKIF
jgi:hypothetical protein